MHVSVRSAQYLLQPGICFPLQGTSSPAAAGECCEHGEMDSGVWCPHLCSITRPAVPSSMPSCSLLSPV